MRALITGAAGFVGGHLSAYAADRGAEVVGPSREQLDLLDAGAVAAAVADVKPDAVFHLAALASVGQSWSAPAETLDNNTRATLNLLEAVREAAPDAVVLAAGSGEQYGPVPEERLPVTEDEPFRPQNPYAVSKAAADLLAGFYADARGLRVIRTRAFNHAGPRQTPTYAVASFARQVAAGRLAGQTPVRIVSGNADVRRDFTDVRCVVRAYRMLALDAEPGIYNVCSGRPAKIADLIATLAEVAGTEIEHVVDPALVRPHEVMEIRGDHGRLTRATGWEPRIPLRRTLAEAVAWWEAELARA